MSNTIPTKRLPDWQTRMEAFMAARAQTPFTWGTNDCATFAADCVLAITGHDPAPKGLRGNRTAKQAYRFIGRHGSMAALATSSLGEPVPLLMAGVGDVVLVKAGKRDAFAIVNGTTALAPSALGLITVPLGEATHAWRVG
jgi:hypothetical protein